jgi:hypothetical protein
MADLDTSEVFVSTRYNLAIMVDTIKHELSHIIRGNELHDDRWYCTYQSLGGVQARQDIFDLDVGNITVVRNIGNITGIQNLLLDYVLLSQYRKFSQRVLGTEGQWEFKGDNKIRLIPTPRGSYPVVIEYIPIVNRFPNATSKEITKRMLVAEAKIILGNARSKFGNIPAPDGGSLSLNGSELRTEGQAEKAQCITDALLLGEPLPIIMW